MNKPKYSILSALAALAFIFVSAAQAQVTSLPQVKGADPERDFKLAVTKGDLRFLAVNGAAPGIVPGTDQHGADSALIEAQGTRTIRGTSDFRDMDLNILAYKYAETYNRILLAHLRNKPK